MGNAEIEQIADFLNEVREDLWEGEGEAAMRLPIAYSLLS